MRFVDVHSHVVPSGDDGAKSVAEGVELCRFAVDAGTRILFATPHVHAPWDTYPWTDSRAQLYEECFPQVREGAAALGLDLRRGFEVFPSEALALDLAAFRLEGTEAVLVEFPGSWLDVSAELGLVGAAVERVLAAGLTPVLAHPERCKSVAREPSAVRALVERGALLCLNSGSLVGDHGAKPERVAWQLAEEGLVALAASDGHRARRPPVMDVAYEAAVARLGERAAAPLFDGSALPWVDEASSSASRVA